MEQPTIQPIENKPGIQELSVDHASRLLFMSFRFSQGDAELQKDIFAWLHYSYPQYRLKEDTLKEILDKVLFMSKEFITREKNENHTSRGGSQNPEWIRRQVDSNLDKLCMNLNDSKEIDSIKGQTILANLARFMIGKDHHFLVGEKGRPHGKGKMVSQIVLHALNHKPTGSNEYNIMFQQIGDFIKTERANHLKGIPSILPLSYLREIEKVHRE